MSPIDAQLVRRTLDGDRDAFGHLVERHAGKVYSVAFGTLLDSEDAKDVVQSAFTRAFERIQRLKSPDNFGAWIVRIADNEARSLIRRRRRERKFDPTLVLPGTSIEPMELDAWGDDVKHLLLDGVGRLPESQRIPLMLRYMGRASYTDIAACMLISVGAAQKRVERALDSLRVYCDRVGIRPEDADSLCSRCLTFPIALNLAGSVVDLLRSQRMPKPVHGGTLTRQVAYAVVGGATVLSLLGGYAFPQATDEVAPTPDGTKTIQLTLLGDLKRRVVRDAERVPVEPDEMKEILSPGDEHLGWIPTNATRDATNVAFQREAYVEGFGGAVVANDEGVHKPLPLLRGTVALDVWVKSVEPASNVGIGFRLGEGSDATSAHLLIKNERNLWISGHSGVSQVLGPANPLGERVRIVYRTDSATFDIYRDGVPSIVWAAVPTSQHVESYRDRPVTGISLISGRGNVRAPLYFDDMRLKYSPSTEKRAVVYGPGPDVIDTLRLLDGNVNNRTVRDGDVLAVEAGSDLRGYIMLEAKSVHDENGAFLLVVVPGWGDRTANYSTAVPRVPPGNSRHRVAFELKAPDAVGDYYLWFVCGTETDGMFVASATNWPNKTPVWNDGNDIADWTNTEYRIAAERGSVAVRLRQDNGVYTDVPVAAACLRIRVGSGSVARR